MFDIDEERAAGRSESIPPPLIGVVNSLPLIGLNKTSEGIGRKKMLDTAQYPLSYVTEPQSNPTPKTLA